MVNIPEKIEQPLTRDTVLSLNRKRVQDPLDRQNVDRLNAGNHRNEPSPYRDQPRREPHVGANRPPVPAPQPAAPRASNEPQPPLLKQVQKGQKILLDPSRGVRRISARMGWRVLNRDCDVDVSAFLLQNGRVPGDGWFVFYGQESSPDGSTVFSSGASPDRESISIDFTRLNSAVDKIVLIMTINEASSQNLNFSMIQDAYIRILDEASGRELVSFKIEEYYPSVISMTIGEVYLHKGEWKFNAVGNGVGKDLAGLCRQYGVRVE